MVRRIGYYRLSGYWYPFQEARQERGENGKSISVILEKFRSGTSFSQVVDLYVFDKKLRLLLLDALERIEIGLRVDIAHLLGRRDSWAHHNVTELHEKFTTVNRKKEIPHTEWLKRLDKAFKVSKEEFILHYRQSHPNPLPIWMAIELWDFGTLSHFLDGMKIADIEALAEKYTIPSWELLPSWTHSMNYIRNICAHHSRIWNRTLTIQPRLSKAGAIPLLAHLGNNRHAQLHLYGVVALMQYLLRTINPSSSWGKRLTAHMQAFPTIPGLSVHHAGFPEGWEQLALWQNSLFQKP